MTKGMVALSLLVCACGKPTALSTFEDIQKAACNGDTASALKLMDRGKMRDAALAGSGVTGGALKAIAEKAVDEGMREIVADIGNGKNASFCLATDVSAQGNRVHWVTPSGRKKHGNFEPRGDGFVMVEIGND